MSWRTAHPARCGEGSSSLRWMRLLEQVVKYYTKWIAIGCACVLLVLVVWSIAATISFSGSGRICKGVAVSGIELSGKTKAAATGEVRNWARERVEQKITLTALDTRWTGAVSAFGARVDWEDAVERAYAVGRAGGIFTRVRSVLFTNGSHKRITANIVVDESQVKHTIGKVAEAINRPHKDASVKVVDGLLEIEQDAWGIKLNEEEAAASVAESIKRGGRLVSLPVEADKPNVVADDIKSIDTRLASFTTRYNTAKRDRSHNLVLGAQAIDGVILNAGQEFSYNEVVGPRLTERGYRDAPIFVRGVLEPGTGGGVCQVSTTLYNAVLLAGLDVVERAPHSRVVAYVVPGRDATVAYGFRDFRFKNSNSSPICVIVRTGGGVLTMDIYGAAADKKNIKVYTSSPKYFAAGEETIVDESLKPGERKVIDKGARGVTVSVWKKTTAADGSVKTELVSNDRYRAMKAIVAVGPSEEEPTVSVSTTESPEPGTESPTQ